MTKKGKGVRPWRLMGSFFSGHKEKAKISVGQNEGNKNAAEDGRSADAVESPRVSAKRNETPRSNRRSERIEVLPERSMTTPVSAQVSAEGERIRELMRAATALSDTDPNAAVEAFREAAALIPLTETDYTVAPFLRVPRYLQLAGRQEEAWEEFQRLLEAGYPNMQQGKRAWHRVESAVYDQMRLFLQREKRPAEAVLYGVRSIVAGVRTWTVPKAEHRYRLESRSPAIRDRAEEDLRRSESHRMERLEYEQAEETLDKQLTKLLKRARLQSYHDEALTLLREWVSHLPEADDVAYEALLRKLLRLDVANTDDRYTAAEAFFERCLGAGWRTAAPVGLSGEDVTALLWPFNEVFHPRLSEVERVAYDPRFEAAADGAIDDLATTMDLEVLGRGPAEVVRVLLERHKQLLVVAQANQIAANPVVTTLPFGLSPDQQRVGVALLLLRGLQFPWPPGGSDSPG